ncbi:MAG: hypothetical protein ACHQ2Z_13100 [Elusimicrobiota bacterium]
MRTNLAVAAVAAIFLAASAAGYLEWAAGRREQAAARAVAESSEWFPAARWTARFMIERYGPPQEISGFELRWNGPPPWKRIVVQNEPQSPLENVVALDVPANKLGDLARFPHDVRLYAREGALGARSDSEPLNIMTLNLAHDIVAGETTPEAAERFFVRASNLAQAGKSSPYMERLLFTGRQGPSGFYPVP